MPNDFEAEFLGFGRFTMMLARECLEAFGESDKAHGKRAVLENFCNTVIRSELF